jgi:hypothetical protein
MFGIILSIGSAVTGLMYFKNQNQNQKQSRDYINAQFFTIMYKLVYVFSFLQIKCIKVFKYLTDFLSHVNPMVSIEIRDNKAYIISQKYKNGNKLLNNTNSNLDAFADLVIIKENNLSLVINPLTTQESCINIIESNVRFISVTLIYNDERYKLSLKTPEYNFYVIGNKIDKSFLQYYLVNILYIPFLSEAEVESELKDEYKTRNFEYILEVMDNDVNYIYLNETQYILLDLDNYSLH